MSHHIDTVPGQEDDSAHLTQQACCTKGEYYGGQRGTDTPGTREVGAGIAHHKRRVRQIYMEVRSQGNLDCLDDILDPEYVGYDPTATPPVVRGPDGFREQTRGYRRVFSDLQFSIRSLVAEGDEVIVRWAATGTHRQSLMGEPPTGSRIETTGFGSWTFRNGKVVEHFGLIDLLGLREQLGERP